MSVDSSPRDKPDGTPADTTVSSPLDARRAYARARRALKYAPENERNARAAAVAVAYHHARTCAVRTATTAIEDLVAGHNATFTVIDDASTAPLQLLTLRGAQFGSDSAVPCEMCAMGSASVVPGGACPAQTGCACAWSRCQPCWLAQVRAFMLRVVDDVLHERPVACGVACEACGATCCALSGTIRFPTPPPPPPPPPPPRVRFDDEAIAALRAEIMGGNDSLSGVFATHDPFGHSPSTHGVARVLCGSAPLPRRDLDLERSDDGFAHLAALDEGPPVPPQDLAANPFAPLMLPNPAPFADTILVPEPHAAVAVLLRQMADLVERTQQMPYDATSFAGAIGIAPPAAPPPAQEPAKAARVRRPRRRKGQEPKRPCGHCKQLGHYRTTCPSLAIKQEASADDGDCE
jgi:hypothetical protein